MPEPSVAAPERDPFFIGWLPMPRPYARVLVPLAGVTLVALVVSAWLVADSQRSPGDGTWGDDAPTTLEGVVYAKPYAMIRVPSPELGGTPKTVLLVEEGKFGAKDRAKPHDGQPVRVSGTLLARDGWQMLELRAGAEGLQPIDLPEPEVVALRRSPPRHLGRVQLRGEIVDAKCYLGAMKPGGGVTHRGCAVLCLRGGVPPLFTTKSNDGVIVNYLLTGNDLGPIDDSIFDVVGVPMTVEAEVSEWDDLLVVRRLTRK
jgi:hypothetical protein